MNLQYQLKNEPWSEYEKSKSIALRNDIIMSHVNLVKYVVQRMMPSYSNYIDFDDMFSYGILGLMDAIEKYDSSKGVKFETYASFRIKGSIIDQLRKQDWVPRGMRNKIKIIMNCFESLEINNGRPATDEEVANYLDMTVEDVKKTLDQSYTFQIISLDEQIMDVVRGGYNTTQAEETPEHQYEEKELKEILVKIIDQLNEKERLVLSLYYYEEMTLKEIGRTLGVTESRVCQIHSKTLLKLRAKMKKLIQ